MKDQLRPSKTEVLFHITIYSFPYDALYNSRVLTLKPMNQIALIKKQKTKVLDYSNQSHPNKFQFKQRNHVFDIE